MSARLLLDERILGDGRHASTWASFADGRVSLDDNGVTGQLSVTALERVMVRYGLPLEAEIVLDPAGDVLELGEGRRLRRFRHHAPVDATGRDYLVWEAPDRPAVAVIATHATAALRYLVLRLDGERSPNEQ